ncbi:mRNA-decapping enzyme-like protein isoform X2 [Physcomitrium patens]|uniref:mRNA-decapping enzyme-like protein n=1 Tax=Physcomitrium patens TaxID=3218 RepID=A0A7I4DYK6_PHYPA|nr:mRNA-decapping enzyme-like protein isoform X2 [Physcomitrium patens]|eukprot:XP_024378805.1 mRNA-decapping enzyme-like protein isoform X2 [Physcomitrella patens]
MSPSTSSIRIPTNGRSQPRFQFIVMNRRSTDNLVENLLGDFEFEVQTPYILYRNANQETNAIWFYSARECEDVANLFQRIMNAFSKLPPKPRLTPPSSEFTELEAVPTSSHLEGPLERGPLASSALPETQDESFERFFHNTVRSTTPDAIPTTASRPPAAHSLQSRTAPGIASHSPLPMPSIISPSTALPLTSLAPSSALDTPDTTTGIRATLIKPSFFVPPPLTSAPITASASSAPPVPSTAPVKPSHGAPLLQPFPPANPPLSLAPSVQYNVPITRDGVREALNRLVKSEQFIDMVYREMMHAHSV